MPKGGPRPGAGRPAGSRNKRTRELQERLDRLGLDPIAALARLAQHAEAEGDLDVAERAWRQLLPYAGPKPTRPPTLLGSVTVARPDTVLPEPPQPVSTPAIELPSWWQPGRAR